MPNAIPPARFPGWIAVRARSGSVIGECSVSRSASKVPHFSPKPVFQNCRCAAPVSSVKAGPACQICRASTCRCKHSDQGQTFLGPSAIHGSGWLNDRLFDASCQAGFYRSAPGLPVARTRYAKANVWADGIRYVSSTESAAYVCMTVIPTQTERSRQDRSALNTKNALSDQDDATPRPNPPPFERSGNRRRRLGSKKLDPSARSGELAIKRIAIRGMSVDRMIQCRPCPFAPTRRQLPQRGGPSRPDCCALMPLLARIDSLARPKCREVLDGPATQLEVNDGNRTGR